MADLTKTLEFLSPYFSTVEEVVGTLSLFVGGIFGIYVIAIIVRFIFLRKVFQSYKEIKTDLGRIERKLNKLTKPQKNSKKK